MFTTIKTLDSNKVTPSGSAFSSEVSNLKYSIVIKAIQKWYQWCPSLFCPLSCIFAMFNEGVGLFTLSTDLLSQFSSIKPDCIKLTVSGWVLFP